MLNWTGKNSSLFPTTVLSHSSILNFIIYCAGHVINRALWREADAQAACYASNDLYEGVNGVARFWHMKLYI